MEACGPCSVVAGFTLAFALQLRKKHGYPKSASWYDEDTEIEYVSTQHWSEKMEERIDEAQTETQCSENVNVLGNRKEKALGYQQLS